MWNSRSNETDRDESGTVRAGCLGSMYFSCYGTSTTGCGCCGGEATHFGEHHAEPRVRRLLAGGNFHPIQSPQDQTGHNHRFDTSKWPEHSRTWLHFASVGCTNIDASWCCLNLCRAVHALRSVWAAPGEQRGGPERQPRRRGGQSGSEHLQSYSGAAGTHQRGARPQEYPSGTQRF